MKPKIAILDIDGVISNSDERFALAEREANAHYSRTGEERRWRDFFWMTAFDPPNVALDTLIEGAREAIGRLEDASYQVVYLTSRPEPMRQATLAWLGIHRLDGPPLVMKPVIFKYTKTVLWKAEMIYLLAMLFKAQEVLVVDDEVGLLPDLSLDREIPYTITCYSSLALQDEDEDEEDENPF